MLNELQQRINPVIRATSWQQGFYGYPRITTSQQEITMDRLNSLMRGGMGIGANSAPPGAVSDPCPKVKIESLSPSSAI